jgi:multicomponent Na+:H+ antiporter subunit B
VKHDIILRVIAKLTLPFMVLFAVYVQFHGDFGPGGGFQAGVIFASGFVLYGLVFGLDRAQRLVPRAALWTLVALGPVLYVGLGVVNMLRGGAFLDYDTLNAADPAAGQHLGILLVESAIGVTVAAVMTSIFFGFTSRGVSRGVAR